MSKNEGIKLTELKEMYSALLTLFDFNGGRPLAVVVRKKIWLDQNAKRVGRGEEKLKNELKKSVFLTFQRIASMPKYERVEKKRFFLLMTPLSRWQKNINGVKTDPYAGHFADLIKHEALIVRRKTHDKEEYLGADFLYKGPGIINLILARAMVRIFIFFKSKKISDIERVLSRSLSGDYNLKEAIRISLQDHIAEFLMWRTHIKNAEPQIALFVCGYDNYAFLHACKHLNVTTVELQHGLIHDEHFAYHHAPIELFADHFLAFGNFWLNNCQLPLPKQNQWCIGSPWIEEVSGLNLIKTNKAAILISQPIFTAEDFTAAFNLIDSLSDLGYEIRVKPHPKDPTDVLECWRGAQSGRDNVQILDKDINLAHEIAGVEVVFGKSSTALIEAVAMKKIVITTEASPQGVIKKLVEIGAIIQFSSAMNFNLINPISSDLCSSLYAKNSIQRFSNFLSKCQIP